MLLAQCYNKNYIRSMLVTVDGKEVTRVKYEGYAGRKNGMAYLLSSYDPNCFDNLSVTP